MNKFKALLRKDWQIHKSTILIPFWIIAAFYLINIVIVLTAYFTGNMDTLLQNEFGQSPAEAISFMGNALLVVFPGWLFLLFVIITTQGALNEDKKIKCELFHRSQPVSVWQRTASKLSVGILGNLGVFLIISVINAVVLNILLVYTHAFDFSSGFQGLLIAQLAYLKSAIVIGSFAFFMSAVFDNSAFFKFIAILIALNIIILILNGVYNWSIPTPMKYFSALIRTNPVFPDGNGETFNLAVMIKANWSNLIFKMQTLYQLIVAAILYFSGTYIYSKKEIS